MAVPSASATQIPFHEVGGSIGLTKGSASDLNFARTGPAAKAIYLVAVPQQRMAFQATIISRLSRSSCRRGPPFCTGWKARDLCWMMGFSTSGISSLDTRHMQLPCQGYSSIKAYWQLAPLRLVDPDRLSSLDIKQGSLFHNRACS